ncbi:MULTISPECIES: hypothetical protein [Billgrantia]|uniref:Lipoprotein n=2 Tax=Billgrantia TaxID=3137761 RepID=A0ABS9APG2_9GAMM|nr:MULTISPECIES: hypothetical protein [Halomonas]MCE8002549.1 hypothetical protein [Halomonas ethanolica]MCE8023659.1 hypothetical protein [Halomonas aerodenitrificans]
MKRLTAAAALAALMLAVSTTAMACDQDDALTKWEQAEEHEIILGAGNINGTMSFAVDEGVWDQLDFGTRLGMVETFQCLVAGPGNVLRTANVINRGGRVLAVWDGISKQLDIK